jgi:hypothetical protein
LQILTRECPIFNVESVDIKGRLKSEPLFSMINNKLSGFKSVREIMIFSFGSVLISFIFALFVLFNDTAD